MKPPDRRLLREILVVAMLKLLLLTLLWQVFVRDHRVQPDSAQIAQRLGASAATSTAAPSSDPHPAESDHDQ